MFPISGDKCLLEFLGKTLLEHQIGMAKRVGLDECIIVANPQNKGRIQEVMTGMDIKFDLVTQKEPLGIANALECAVDFIDDEVIVVNPDDVFEHSPYESLFEARRAGAAIAYLLGSKVRDCFPSGYLVVDEEWQLVRIVENRREERSRQN